MVRCRSKTGDRSVHRLEQAAKTGPLAADSAGVTHDSKNRSRGNCRPFVLSCFRDPNASAYEVIGSRKHERAKEHLLQTRRYGNDLTPRLRRTMRRDAFHLYSVSPTFSVVKSSRSVGSWILQHKATRCRSTIYRRRRQRAMPSATRPIEASTIVDGSGTGSAK